MISTGGWTPVSVKSCLSFLLPACNEILCSIITGMPSTDYNLFINSANCTAQTKKYGSNRALARWSYEYKKALSQLSTTHQSNIMLKRIKGNRRILPAAVCQPAIVRCMSEHSSISIQTKGEVQKRSWNRWRIEVWKCNIKECRSHGIRHWENSSIVQPLWLCGAVKPALLFSASSVSVH